MLTGSVTEVSITAQIGTNNNHAYVNMIIGREVEIVEILQKTEPVIDTFN